jgi:hypothetical protein
MDKNFEKHERTVYRISMVMSAVASVVILLLIVAQAYVRWFKNQEFTFLGGFELEALTVGTFALLVGLAHAYKPKK